MNHLPWKLNAVLAVMLCLAGIARAGEPDVLVLDGVETNFMNEALKRIACPFRQTARIAPGTLEQARILILAGKGYSEGAVQRDAVAAFIGEGGKVLAIGGGAKWMLDAKLFDAEGYYPAGTTIHQSQFEGYHRLTFGYPEAKPYENWNIGVPMLLRATEGPLLRLGAKATSILSAGDVFSLSAYQRVGKGIVLLIGPDPQGGNEYLELTKPVPKLGDGLHTDALLANAIAWLREPQCNLIPNPGFELDADASPERSHWEITAGSGAAGAWIRKDAPEGTTFLQLKVTAKGTASAAPFLPVVVDRGGAYRFACRYRASAPWTLAVRHPANCKDENAGVPVHSIEMPASSSWTTYETRLVIPADKSLASLQLLLKQPGELCLDDVTLAAVAP